MALFLARKRAVAWLMLGLAVIGGVDRSILDSSRGPHRVSERCLGFKKRFKEAQGVWWQGQTISSFSFCIFGTGKFVEELFARSHGCLLFEAAESFVCCPRRVLFF